jgi:hypothetical protein
MSELQQRNYYKIFTGTNQATGYDKIHLGYESNTVEIILQKDKTTYFHVPYFSESKKLSDTSLISDGATSGPIPAMADRIYKKLGNYKDTTPWGPGTIRTDGTWLCSWLYQEPGQAPKWLDRYYNPGRLSYEEALRGEAQFTDYIKYEPLYYDKDTELIFEPGGYFHYFHVGENEIQELVQTFNGDDQARIGLNIENWSTNTTDNSIFNNSIIIKDSNPNWFKKDIEPSYKERNVVSFENTDFLDIKVLYNDSYNLQDEFTISFWFNHSLWTNATSTQLLGNRNNGGYEIFYNNLNYNPFYVVPENTYGHLFYFNESSEIYLEKSVKPTLLTTNVSPFSVNINSNNEVITLDTNNKLLKYNHLGDVLATSKTPIGNSLQISGEPKLSIIDKDDSTIVITTSGTFIYDKDLILISQNTNSYTPNEQIAFNTQGNLVRELSCTNIKFDSNNNKWTIGIDFKLYYNNALFTELQNYICTTIGIDPEKNIWVVTNSEDVFKVNPTTLNILSQFKINALTTETINPKNISFIQNYNRKTNSFNWYAIIYASNEKTLYQLTLDGKVSKTVFLPESLNILDPDTALQDKNLLTFTSQGDFTGYERRRIFNKIKYNNEPQVQFKITTQTPFANLPTSIFTLSTSAKNFINNAWQLVTVICKNKKIDMYVNNILRDSLILPNNTKFAYTFKNDLNIGIPNGKTENLNYELNTRNIIWNGNIDSIRIYNYALTPKVITILNNEKIIVEDIVWNIPTSNLQYIEIIDRFFKHQLPGFKSHFFNLKISGSQITDIQTRKIIEENIKKVIEQVKPAYTELFRIDWVD